MSADETAVRRAEIVATLSLATDLAMGQPMGFGLRSCIQSMRLADRLGFEQDDRLQTYFHALLRYAGCTSQSDTLAALFGDEIALRQDFAQIDPTSGRQMLPMLLKHLGNATEERNPLAFLGGVLHAILESRGATAAVFASHCEVAGRLAERLGLTPNVARNLGQLYERWDGKGQPAGLAGTAIAPAVRVVTLIQDGLVLLAALPREDALAVLRSRSAKAYDPQMLQVLLGGAEFDGPDDEDQTLFDTVVAMSPEVEEPLTPTELDGAAEVIADFIDLKSPVIAGHSRAVAELASAAAASIGLPRSDVSDLRRAGLLHDLGYVAIPARLRMTEGKAGEASEPGRLHPYYGERLLARAPGLARLGAIISEHHERLDGSGFHRGVKAVDISLPSRILAAAEAYQSLVEDRPFRVTLSAVQAAARLREGVRVGQLDGDAVKAVLETAGQGDRRKKLQLVAGLTPREMEVLRLLAQGQAMKQIARRLGVSPKTIDNHLQAIYGKVGVKTRGGATLFALEHGLLRPGSET